jgi:hypothetical protein
MDNDTFEEYELNHLYMITRAYIKRNTWDVTDETEWEHLKSLKGLEEKIARMLDGGQ